MKIINLHPWPTKWLSLTNDDDILVVYVAVGYDGGDDGTVDYELYVYTIHQFLMYHRAISYLLLRGSKNNTINMF